MTTEHWSNVGQMFYLMLPMTQDRIWSSRWDSSH